MVCQVQKEPLKSTRLISVSTHRLFLVFRNHKIALCDRQTVIRVVMLLRSTIALSKRFEIYKWETRLQISVWSLYYHFMVTVYPTVPKYISSLWRSTDRTAIVVCVRRLCWEQQPFSWWNTCISIRLLQGHMSALQNRALKLCEAKPSPELSNLLWYTALMQYEITGLLDVI